MAQTAVSSEQTGQLAAARLVLELPDLDARTCLADQTSDEARHAEAFARYVRHAGEEVVPDEGEIEFQKALDRLTDPMTLLLVHTFLEGWAADVFAEFVKAFRGDILGDIYRRVRRDEARHVRNGVAISRRLISHLPAPERQCLCEGAAAYASDASGQGPEMWKYICSLSGSPVDDLAATLRARHLQRVAAISRQ